MAEIWYFGNGSLNSTSGHRASSLKRLGHSVSVYDPEYVFTKQLHSPLLGRLHFKTGYRFLQPFISTWLGEIIKTNTVKPDLIWVDSGELFGKKNLELLKSLGCPLILYNIDDPTGKRDGHRFDSLLNGILIYDLVVVVREESKEELKQMGVLNIIRVFRSYDEIAHKPLKKANNIISNYCSEVVFVGTWMKGEGRDEFMLKLVNSGININIWGDRWEKSKYWHELKPFVRGKALYGNEYVATIQNSKVCLGLTSKQNRDQHTTRSLEIPYAGGLLCAERTSEHLSLYEDGVEAVFWSSPDECIEVCKKLLKDNNYREQIREAGMKKIRTLKVGNENICSKIIEIAIP